MMSGSLWSRAGFAGVVIIVSLTIWGLLIYFGPQFGIDTELKQLLMLAGSWIFLLIIRYMPFLLYVTREKYHRGQEQKNNALPADESRLAQAPAHNMIVTEIRHALHHLYGRRWPRKVHILLVTGTVAEVEQLTPGLTTQYWQEDRGTLLLWGGDLNSAPDTQWLMALRKLRHRPADGMVWVTCAFDRLPASELASPPEAPPSDSMMDTFAQAIRARNDALGWVLPLYVWSLHLRAGAVGSRVTQSVGCLLPAGCTPESLPAQLTALVPPLISQGIRQISHNSQHHFLLALADQLTRDPQTLAGRLSLLLNPYRPLPLAGIVFSQPSAVAERRAQHHWGRDKRWDVLPDSVCELPAALRPYQPAAHWRKKLPSVLALSMVLWGCWMVVSFISNRHLIVSVQQQALQASVTQQPLAERLQVLAALQKVLARLQYRAEQGVPWYDRAGLSHNNELLAALLPRYRTSAQPLLRDAAASHLAAQLNAFIVLPPDSPLREQQAKTVYDQLKLYLMLARPDHMNAAWFSETLSRDWRQRPGVTDALWQGMTPSLLAFYATHLAADPQGRLAANETMVSQARALLVRLMGMRNSESTQYQKMLAEVVNQYADMRLEDMTGDTDYSRLFTTNEVVPGMFTRQAWEQSVQAAIARVVKERRDELDWVLTDSQQIAQQSGSPEALQQRLTARYFADFGSAWLAFLNSLRLNRENTLPGTIEQLTLMADIRQSPLIALMNTLNVQGRTGQTGEEIADSLVKSAKNLLGRETREAIDQTAGLRGPLDATFGPILALMDKNPAAGQAQSLQSYLSRVTQVRLRLQQVTNAVDPQAMTQTLAQTVFQGKAVDLTDTRDYGSLIAAGLGQEWSSFGRTVFVQPMEQAWQQVLMPAADSLNTQWQLAVVRDWNTAFGGRYPFSNSSSDVSLPLLAKYLNADSGRITQFLQTRLKGVLHREGSRWVPDSINAQGLTFNPEFLTAMNTLSQLSDVAFMQGNAGMHFDLRPGTGSGVMQTDLVIDGQKLNYVNQMPVWKRFTWPADTEASGASLSWRSTQTGTRQYADIPGAWGWIRLLDKAAVSAYPGLGSSYSLRWKALDGRNLNYTLRTEAGEGPMALLKLRNFRLPETIFSADAPGLNTQDDVNDDTQEVY